MVPPPLLMDFGSLYAKLVYVLTSFAPCVRESGSGQGLFIVAPPSQTRKTIFFSGPGAVLSYQGSGVK